MNAMNTHQDDNGFARVSMNDYAIVSETVGTVGYEFSDDTIEIFRKCMNAYLNAPEEHRGDWKEFVKRFM